ALRRATGPPAAADVDGHLLRSGRFGAGRRMSTTAVTDLALTEAAPRAHSPALPARAEAWLFAPGDARRLAALRIGLCGLLAIRLSRGSYRSLAGQPSSLFRPRSFMHLFASMPPGQVVLAVQIVAVAAALFAAVGWRAR